MANITIPNDTVEVSNEEGQVILSESALDIYYTIVGSNTELAEASTKVKMTEAAKALKAEYDCDMTWGQVAHLLNSLDDIVNKLKKNTTQEQE